MASCMTGTKNRRNIHRRLAAIALATAAFTSLAAAQLPARYELADLRALQDAFAKLAEKVRPSTVSIVTLKAAGSESPERSRVKYPLSHGSGFVIEADGYLVTNRHVIAGADVIRVVLFNGDHHEARVVQTDPRSDLAVLKIDVADLTPVRFGDLSKVKVNHWTFAVGNPFGLANLDGQTSVTFGAVSALNRQMTDRLAGDTGREYYGNLIETSSAINPGSSGGPLFNVDGEVIGVVTAIETRSGVNEGHGFAIPIDENTRRIIDTLKQGEKFRWGFLGVEVAEVSGPVPRWVVHARPHRGAEIREISLADGPAAKAGLKPRDIVLDFNEIPVEGPDHLVRLVGFTPVGTTVPVTYLREGTRRKTTVTLGDREQLIQAR